MSRLGKDGSLTDPFSNYIATSRYSRWKEDEGRRETWRETVDRYLTHMVSHLEQYDYTPSPELVEEIRENIENLELVPSMRAIMTAGPALERSGIASYNCAYLPLSDLRSLSEMLFILMNGTGVGYSVERHYTDQLPEVPYLFPTTETIVVEDSKEGWAEAFQKLLESLWSGRIPRWDLSLVRPKGSRLKTFGGRASGPEPLDELFHFTVEKIRGAQGRKLRPIEVHDIACKVASVIVVGGVRRAATISLSDLDDKEMAEAKSGQWWVDHPHRALANNSAVYYDNTSREDFDREWERLVKSGSGERGIFNRDAARRQASKWGRRSEDTEYGCNPCCLTGDTYIMTTDGPRQIKDLKGTPFDAVVNGKVYHAPRGSWISGVGSVYRLKTKEGYQLDLTPEHRILSDKGEWKEAKDYKPGDRITIHNHREFDGWGSQDDYGTGYLLGLFVGDGSFSTSASSGNKFGQIKVWKSEEGVESIMDKAYTYAKDLPHRSDWAGFGGENTRNPYRVMSIGTLPQENGIYPEDKRDISHLQERSSEFYRGFLSGLFDADGHLEGVGNQKGISIRLGQNDVRVLETVQSMLLRLGVKSRIHSQLPESRLVIGADDARVFSDRIGFGNKAKQERLASHLLERKTYSKKFIATVESFEYVGEQEVWDAEVEDVHAFDANGIYAHNSEIILRPYEYCNLSEVIVHPYDTEETLIRKVQLATILGTWQSTITNFPYIREEWKKNAEEEGLLGVSLTGVFGNTLLNTSSPETERLLNRLRDAARETNRREAKSLGINESAAITCVKPSGTVSQLAKVSSGLHPWHSQHYIRTVRESAMDPLARLMKDYGVPCEEDVMNPDNYVFSFPVEAPEGAVTREDLSAVDHLKMWLAYQDEWCEHKPSVTISVGSDEWDEVREWVWEHLDKISGISFLPRSEHTYAQAPYQECTREEYEEAVRKMPEVHWGDLSFYEQEDQTTGSQEYACTAGGCELK